jgi:hypothetical protein
LRSQFEGIGFISEVRGVKKRGIVEEERQEDRSR